jgi:DNA invertase Pin-like site-specific DNA recombinase
VLRLDGYIRVSHVGQRHGERFLSPRIQRARIEEWAVGRGVVLLTVFEELDESGARADRPLLQEALDRVESGVSNGLVAWKVSRFGRSLIDGLQAIERVHAAGGAFYSASEGLDTSTDAGRLVLRIMLSIAEWDLDQLRDSWAQSKSDAVARGVWMGRTVPVGYRRLKSGRLTLDARTAPVVAEAFKRRAAGEPLRTISDFLAANHVRTARGNPVFTRQALARLFRHRAFLGEIRYGPYVKERAHTALIDLATWHEAQSPIRTPLIEPYREPELLSGLLRCATCGMPTIVMNRQRGEQTTAYYGCRKEFAWGRCPRPAFVTAAPVNTIVEQLVLTLLHRRRRAPERRVDHAEAAVDAATSTLAAYRDSDRVLATLGETVFAVGLEKRVAKVRDASLDLADARAAMRVHALPPAADLTKRWPSMDRAAKRSVLIAALDCVFIARGHGHIEQRVIVCPAGTAPRRLPRRYDRLQGDLTARRGWITAATYANEAFARR